MLFIESRILEYQLDVAARLRLLEELQRQGLTPLIRSTRLNCYEQVLMNTGHARAMERSLLADGEDESLPVPGDLFCFEDYVFALIFDGTEEVSGEMRVAIIYEARTREPLHKLDSFCRTISDAVLSLQEQTGAERPVTALALTGWRQQATATGPTAFTRYVARQDVDARYTMMRRETAAERTRAAELLEDADVRQFLQHTHQAHAEGCAAKLLPGERLATTGLSVDQLMGAGLLRPEVLVTCRQTGHSLFRLPTPDALAVVTVSHAACAECGAAVADEKIEETLAPTPLAAALLENGAWLVNRLHSILRELGLPESEIALDAPAGDGEATMMANVCGEPFLFVLRDGPLSPAFARRAIDSAVETQALHLTVIATGQIQNEGRARLLEFARRRARGGNEVEILIIEDMSAAFAMLRDAFERVSRRVLADQLSVLDAALGLNVSRLIINRAQLLQQTDRQSFADLPEAPLPPSQQAEQRDVALASSAGGDSIQS